MHHHLTLPSMIEKSQLLEAPFIDSDHKHTMHYKQVLTVSKAPHVRKAKAFSL